MTYHRFPKAEYYVYFARAGDMMKIGCSRTPLRRLMQIGEWVPFKVELAATIQGAFDLEAALHSHFAKAWSHLEWFHVTSEMEAMVAAINAGNPITVIRKPKDDLKEYAKTLKKRATRRITVAENKAGLDRNYWKRRQLWPDYLAEAVASFNGPHNPPPSASALKAIARYERQLASNARRAA